MDDSEQVESAGEGDGAAGPEPKIGLVVGILGMTAAVAMDALSIIPGVGDVEEIPGGITLALSAITGLGPTVLVAQAFAMGLKALPVVQAFPAWTLAWGATWWIDSHPSKLSSKIEEAATIAAAAEGGGVTGEGAAGVAGAATEAEEVTAEAGSAAAVAGETEAGISSAVAESEAAESAAVEGETAATEVEGDRTRTVEAEEGAGESAEKTPDERAKEEKEQEIGREMRQGEETPWDERLGEEVFDPEDLQFRQARDISAKKAEEETEDEDEQGEESDIV